MGIKKWSSGVKKIGVLEYWSGGVVG